MITTSVSDKQPLLLGGEWEQTKRELVVCNPYNDEIITTVSLATWPEYDEALNRAKNAFDLLREWPSYDRHAILSKTANLVLKHKEEIAKIIMLESGKPIRDARIEVDRDYFTFMYAAEEAYRISGEIIPMDLMPKGRGRIGIYKPFPIGPILGITPFNTPLNLVAHKIAPAIAAGNPILIKPSSNTPITSLKLAEIMVEAGIPEGMLSVLPSTGEVVEKAVQDDRTAMFSFTGSTSVGWRLRNLVPRKRATLELGNSSGVIVHYDADINLAAKGCVVGGFNYAGQSCTSVQRVFVHEEIWDEFVSEVIGMVKNLIIGNPADETTDIGPMITEHAAAKAESWIRDAVHLGAKILYGGHRDGKILEPTILIDVNPKMPIVCNEIFAPVISLMPYSDFDEAVNLLNSTSYGLQHGVYTRDIERIFRAFRDIHVGGLMINEVSAFRVDHMPYGGVKDSGIGHEGIKYAIEEMTEKRFLMLTYELPQRNVFD